MPSFPADLLPATPPGAFLLAAILVVAVPGPSVLFALARTAEGGRGAGLVTVLGLEAGLSVHVVGAAVGLSALVAATPGALTVIRFVGAAYLIHLAVAVVRGRHDARPWCGAETSRQDFWRLLRGGFVVDVLNPKTGLFFLAFLPQFVDPARGSQLVQLMALGAVVVVLATINDSCWVLLVAAVRGLAGRRSDVEVLWRRVHWATCGAYGALAALVILG